MLSELSSVVGPVRTEELGVTMPHEHTFLDGMREDRAGGLVHDVDLITAELAAYREAGGHTIVDCTSRGLRPQPGLVREAARRSGVTIILGTGFYRHPYLDERWFDAHSTDEVADLIIRDIEVGIDDSGVRAGVIGEIGCDRFLTPAEERGFRAAARAALQTGLTITTHAARWPVGLPQLDLLEAEGVSPGRVIIGHCDLVPDTDYHLELASRGAYVQFDNIQAGSAYHEEWLIDAIRRLDEAGYRERILLSHDICLTSHLQANGGVGFGYILRHFVPILERSGFRSEWVSDVLVRNPAAALSGA